MKYILLFVALLMLSCSNMDPYPTPKPPKPTSFMVMLTVYDSTDNRLEGGKYNVLGRELRKGHCAADTTIFPIGTKIRIPKLGISLIVQDIGGAVRGYHIDMFEPGCGDTTREARRLWRNESLEIVVESLP